MSKEMNNLIKKLEGKKEPEELIVDIKESLNGRDLKEQLNILGSLVYYYTNLNLKIENLETTKILDEFIYKLLKHVYQPKGIAFHLGVIGQILLRDYPELARYFIDESKKRSIGIV